MNYPISQTVFPRVEFKVYFRNDHHGRRRSTKEENHSNSNDKCENLPRLTKLLALAHRWNRLIEETIVANYSDIARLMGLSRARITQIMNLLSLAPQIQDSIISGRIQSSVNERSVRAIARIVQWDKQINAWERMVG